MVKKSQTLPYQYNSKKFLQLLKCSIWVYYVFITITEQNIKQTDLIKKTVTRLNSQTACFYWAVI